MHEANSVARFATLAHEFAFENAKVDAAYGVSWTRHISSRHTHLLAPRGPRYVVPRKRRANEGRPRNTSPTEGEAFGVEPDRPRHEMRRAVVGIVGRSPSLEILPRPLPPSTRVRPMRLSRFAALGLLACASDLLAQRGRGGTARGATRQAIRAGDVVTTPAGTPHQMLLAPGERITYIAFKVAAP